MSDLFSDVPILDFADVYTESYKNIATISTTISFTLSMIIQPIYIFVVLKRSPKTMKVFKWLLMGYIASTIVFELGILFIKPLILLPFFIIYPVGLLSPMTPMMTLMLVFLTMCK